MPFVIQTSNLCKNYKKSLVVDNVNLHVNKGKIYGFIGQNGAGKTTIIRMILSLVKPTDGEVELFGEKIIRKNIYKHLRKIGAIIETPGFYPNLTGYENLDIHRIMMDIADKSSINHALQVVGMMDQKDKKVSHYSLGMRQRLGIARALLHEPELLILDEPTNGLDPQGVVEIRDLLIKIANQGKTIFISSHILSEIEKIVNRVGILHNGRLLEEFSCEDFQKKCEHFLQYKVDNKEKAVNILKDMIENKEMSVSQDIISIKVAKTDISESITKRFVESGIKVYESKVLYSSLEDYFLKVTGGIS